MGQGHGRLAELGFDSYADYLASPHWQERRKVAGDAADWKCACGKRATQIHHRSYRNVGQEKPNDLRAVCAGCHKEIHRRVDDGMSLQRATDLVLAERIGPNVVRLPDAKRPEHYGRKSKPGRGRKKKKRKVLVKPRDVAPPGKRIRALVDENDRLHAIQARNRERQMAARAARKAIRGPSSSSSA